MKLTTKRNRWYFWRELFAYMIPMILIVWTIDVFYHFVQCSLHPERSVPCSVNWILASIYWIFLLLTISFEIISAKSLRNVKKQIEDAFVISINSSEIHDKEIPDNKKKNNKSENEEWIIDMIEKNKHEEDDKFEEWKKSKDKETTKKRIFKKRIKKENN